MEKFDYKLCMERDGGMAVFHPLGKRVQVIGRGNSSIHEDEAMWYPCCYEDGTYIAIPDFELFNLSPPKPELKPVDVVWWGSGQGEPAAVAVRSGHIVAAELRRITVDPNALTADELAEHGVYIEMHQNGSIWDAMHGISLIETADTESAARLAATEWLRKEGQIE